ncbi:MAG TPA: chloride channel protein [Kofleriaceae bacterium]|nr:chloride channel protein [Kofleriaceae bacterium]
MIAAARNVVGVARNAVARVGLLVAPSLSATLGREDVEQVPAIMDRRDAVVAGYATAIGLAAYGVAEVLIRAIALVTNVAFYQRWSFSTVSPAGNSLGYFVVAVPVIGGIIVGLMARFGSRAIRGHGIPEAMEQILTNESKIPLRLTFLKPASAAIAIGTGGPFGAEGPIIATGGALGSVFGQLVKVSASERKTLLAAGAAAGMAAIFGTPIAAVLIAIELLLFEYRARSVVPVALAAAAAGGLRVIFHGGGPVFEMPELAAPNAASGITATVAGAIVGLSSTYITRIVYWIEDRFEELPVHWMWWPAIGAVAVGVIGVFEPRTLGVGYDNITGALAGNFTTTAIEALCAAKLVSWAIALGSGTSGGTLAPLMTFGSGMGWLLAHAASQVFPYAGIDPRVGALVGMTAMFAGASRALMASIAFALESTQQIHCVVPIVAGVSLAYFASCIMMRTTIMTEKLARRGVRVAGEYDVDPLAHVVVDEIASRDLRVIEADQLVSAALGELRARRERHQAYPVVRGGVLVGVITARELLAADGDPPVGRLLERKPVSVFPGDTVRTAVDRMSREHVGRLVVVDSADPTRAIGIVTRSDIIGAFTRNARKQLQPEGL